MIEAYEVGVSLVMNESILDSLTLVNSKLMDTQQLIEASNAVLRRFNALTRDGVGSSAAMANAWKKVAGSVTAASDAAARMGGGAVAGPGAGAMVMVDDTTLASVSELADKFEASLGFARGINTALKRMDRLTGAAATSATNLAGAWERVATSVAVASSVMSKTGGGSALLGRSGSGGKKEDESDSGDKLLGALVGGEAAKGLFDLFGDTLNQAGAMQQQIAIQQGAGIAAKQIALNTKAAWAAANGGVTDVSPQQAMATITMLRSLLGSSAEARTALDPVLKTEVGLQAALGPQAAASLIQSLKAIDISGGMVSGTKISVQKMLGLLPYIAQAMVQTHGVLTGAQILRMMQQAGPAASATSFKNLIMHMAEITAAIGTGAGRGLFTAYMATSIGRVSAVSAAYLEKLGLLKASQLHKVQGSSTYLFNPNDLYGAKYLQQNGLVDWIHNKIVPYLEKRGDKTPQELIRDISGMLPASTAARVAAYIINNMPQIQRTQDNIEKGVKTNALYNSSQKVWSIQLQNFEKAWDGLMTALGTPVIGKATAYLNEISDSIHKFTGWMGAHPGYAKLIETSLLGITAAMGAMAVFLGAGVVVALVGTGGILPMLGAAFAAFAGVMAAFNWNAIVNGMTSALDGIWNLITKFIHDIAYVATHPLADLKHLGSAIGGVFTGQDNAAPTAYNPHPYNEPGMDAQQLPGWSQSVGVQPYTPPAAPQPVYVVGTAPVHVTNPRDIHNGTARSWAQQLNGIQTGPTGFDSSFGIPTPAGAW